MALHNEEPKAIWSHGTRMGQAPPLNIIILFSILVILTLLGLANLYSASSGYTYFRNQIVNLVVVVPAFILTALLLPMRMLAGLSWWIYIGTVISLAVVYILGTVGGGAQRWIRFGFIGFQPSEFAKLAVAIITAHFFSSQRISSAYRIRDLLPIIATVGLIFILIFLQPDFGTAGLCLLIFLCQLAFVRIDSRSILVVASISPIVAILGWTIALRPYQKMRILNFFNPNLDPQNTGYNSLQSLIAIGSGNGFGKGYMQGTQAQLKFLPARHTDFIFSVLAEEHGFLGGVIVFGLFLALTYVALDIAQHAKDTFSSILAIGIAAFIFLEFAINIAMVLGLFPVVGLPLPFFSYGSSNMFTVCISVGILIAIERETLMTNRL